MIPLMKTTFLNERRTKEALAEFVLQASRLSMGEQCERFERRFARFQGSKDAVLFNSGGSANLAMFQAMKNLGVLRAGDAVGFSALTWSTNVMPILQLGFRPVPVDCEPSTLNSMSHLLEARLEKENLKAFFITNALGFCGDLDRIRKICSDRGILLVEDNCEALGTELPAGRTGSFGTMASFSFYVAHQMSTVEGGMVCTDDEEFGAMLRIVRANGWDRDLTGAQQQNWRKRFDVTSEFYSKYTFYDLGYNLRPTEITGFLGNYQMQFLEENIASRGKNHRHLEGAVADNPDLVGIDRSHIKTFSPFAFPILCRSREIKEKYLSRFSGAGVEVRPMIAGNIQKQPFYRKYVSEEYDLRGTDTIHECGFYCGNYPEMTVSDLETIRSCLGRY